MTTNSLSLPSFAKINLSLRVLGKRSDGYHEIRTVLQTISLRDELHFDSIESDQILFSCDDPGIPTDATNLVVKAAHALRHQYNIKAGASIHLQKRIPMQAGLGGGSSNAAITLLGLSRLWNVTPPAAELAELAATLGADVPFFLLGGRAEATGIGTELSSLAERHKHHLLIVCPQAKVPTVTAYNALNALALTTPSTASILAISRRDGDFSDSELWPLCDHLENDFERVIFDMEPEIRRVKAALQRSGARCALLAGSGSSVFGVFATEETLQTASETLREESGWRIFSCVTLSREEYLQALSSASPGR